MINSVPICFACVWRAKGAKNCKAFPDGIPNEIAIDGFDHRQPFEGDGGTTFVMKNGAEKILAMYETARQGK